LPDNEKKSQLEIPEPCGAESTQDVKHIPESDSLRDAVPDGGLSVRDNFAWTLAGNSAFALCQWGIIVLLAKLGSADMVGQFALAVAVAFPITYLANLQLRVIFVTDLQGKYPASQMLGLRLMLAAIAVIGALLACGIAKYGTQMTRVVIAVAAAQLVDCISENYYGVAQRRDRMDRIARSQILRSAVSIAFLAVTIFYTRDVFWGVVAYAAGRLIVLLAYDAGRGTFAQPDSPSPVGSYAERIRPRWNLANQVGMVWTALPLGFVSVLGSLNGNMPRYFIEHSLGAHELGIFSALNYIPAAALMVATALGYAVFARLSRLYFVGDIDGYKSVLAKATAVCGGLGIAGLLGAALLGKEVLTLLYRPEYAEHVDLLLWLMGVGAVGCVASCLGCAMSAASQFRVQVPLFLVVTASSGIGCYFLVPTRGLFGAAFAALIAMCVQLVGTAIVIHRALHKRARELSGDLSAGVESAFQSP
jgi:O-antigen/teichoic acid export membrane protein